MMSDEDELDRMNWNSKRLGRSAAARDDPVRHPQPPSQDVASLTINVSTDADDNDDIPLGQVAEVPDDDEVMEEAGADELPPLHQDSDNEVGPAL